MEDNSFSNNEIIKISPKLDNKEIFDSEEEEERINTSNSYSVPTSSMYYNNEEINSDSDNYDEDIKKSDSQKQSNKILPKSLTSDNKRKSISSDKESNIDASSIVVQINDADDDIDIEHERYNDSFVVMDHNNSGAKGAAAENLKKKLEMGENRISLATSTGEMTFVENNQSQTPRNDVDLPMPEKSDITNTNLKRLTDTTSVPPVVNDNIKQNVEDIDKATADISNKEHAIDIEDEDNTCAICLIETEKPTDIENIGGSNETVVAPTKEQIDNYECKLHCMHKFHYSCIAQWLERSQNCPICRVDIKHYEIEAIEKRFDISIKIKNDDVPVIVPHYNTSFDFNIPLTVELVKGYMERHFPWVHFKTYVYTKFIIFFIGFLLLTLFGIYISISSLLKGHEKLYFTFYAYTIILLVSFTLFLAQFIYNIISKKTLLYMIKIPTGSTYFYGIVSLLFLMIFVTITYLTETPDLPFTIEKIFEYCIILFFGGMLIWSYVEAIICYKMFQEEDRRIVDADVTRRTEEIAERIRREEAAEREEFERNFSHLND